MTLPQPPVEWLFLDADTPAGLLAPWLAAALPHCAWSCHVVVTGGDSEGQLLGTVVDYLKREEVAMIYLHLVADGGMGTPPEIEGLLDAAARFQIEAYRERTGARLVPLPILEVAPGADPGSALKTAGNLAGRLAKPSLLLWDEPVEPTITTAAALGLRLYLGSKTLDTSIMEILTAAHVLDSTMSQMDGAGTLLAPCWAHNVVAGGRTFDCGQQWRRGRSRNDLAYDRPPDWQPDPSLCAGCIADTIAGMTLSLVANQRQHEGRELALRASSGLVDTGSHLAAAEVAQTAADLSRLPQERADAMIQTALCRLAAGQFREADKALQGSAECGAPAGLIAYHRAHVQVAWRDDIEALDRFAEALDFGLGSVSVEDLHFEMALSHIRLEEWPDARSHLEQSGGPSPAIAFNQGVCDVNDGQAERALTHFDSALEIGPPDEDLGRVRFFRGFCLKELERYEEAVEDFAMAIELEEPELAHYNSLGFCLFKLGRYTEAVESFEKAVAVDPVSAVDWANIGVNLERAGEVERAAEMYRKALGMDGGIGFAREGLERIERG
jgi:tetratricopeptide (TPR) repeat protein